MKNLPSAQGNTEIISTESGKLILNEERLKHYDYHAKEDAKHNIYRIGNELMSQMRDMNPKSWRLMELAIKKLDLYSSGLPRHKDFINGLENGDKYIPPEFRTISITAKEYSEAYKLQPKTGITQFTNSALELLDEKLYSVDEIDGEKMVSIEHVIGKMTFKVRKNKSNLFDTYFQDDMIKTLPSGKKKLSHLSGEIKLELSMYTAKGLFLIMNQFTRISSTVTQRLSASSHKLYAIMCMERAYNSRGEPWVLAWSLETWNSRLGTNHKSMATLIRTFNAHKEITEHTDIIADAYKDESSKVGKSYKLFIVKFWNNRNFTLIENGDNGPKRDKLPRKSSAAQVKGSHEEGEWARACIKILMRFRSDCEKAGKTFPKRDAEALDNYLKITGGLFDRYE